MVYFLSIVYIMDDKKNVVCKKLVIAKARPKERLIMNE